MLPCIRSFIRCCLASEALSDVALYQKLYQMLPCIRSFIRCCLVSEALSDVALYQKLYQMLPCIRSFIRCFCSVTQSVENKFPPDTANTKCLKTILWETHKILHKNLKEKILGNSFFFLIGKNLTQSFSIFTTILPDPN